MRVKTFGVGIRVSSKTELAKELRLYGQVVALNVLHEILAQEDSKRDETALQLCLLGESNGSLLLGLGLLSREEVTDAHDVIQLFHFRFASTRALQEVQCVVRHHFGGDLLQICLAAQQGSY